MKAFAMITLGFAACSIPESELITATALTVNDNAIPQESRSHRLQIGDSAIREARITRLSAPLDSAVVLDQGQSIISDRGLTGLPTLLERAILSK
jgi:hypothetical protein